MQLKNGINKFFLFQEVSLFIIKDLISQMASNVTLKNSLEGDKKSWREFLPFQSKLEDKSLQVSSPWGGNPSTQKQEENEKLYHGSLPKRLMEEPSYSP